MRTSLDPPYEYETVGGIDLRRLHDRLYRGAIVRFHAFAGMEAIVALTRAFVEARFGADPQHLHLRFPPDALAEEVSAAQREYSRSEEVKRAWRAMFAAIGFDPEHVARDRLVLRFQPHRDRGDTAPSRRSIATVRFHRDSWGTNLYAQVNWWAPVYPIAADRTFAFFPDLWSKAVGNSSAAFDMREAMRLVQDRIVSAKPGEIVPQPIEPIDEREARPVVIDCGEIIAFSSQHAHAGVPNHSGTTRISLETRTLLIDDHRAGAGAPNIDGRARWMSPGLFRRLSDGKPLHELLQVDRLVPFERPLPAPAAGGEGNATGDRAAAQRQE